MSTLLTLAHEFILDKIVVGLNMSARGYPMRDLMFMLAPVALIVYFVVYPDQFVIVRRVGGTVTSLDPTAPTAAGSALAPVYDFARSIQSLSGVTSSIVAYR